LKLPNPERAVVDIAKLRDYCLDPTHRVGGDKALVFRSVLGLDASNAGWLRDRLLDVARGEATPRGENRHGKLYMIDFELRTSAGQATLRSSWIVVHEEDFPRLTTCFVRRKR
jgi:hypothetical protein